MLSVDAGARLGAFELDLSMVHATGCLALVGPSGAGKTTVLRLIAGLQRASRGSIAHRGEVWTDVERRIELAPERRRCGFVFQDYALFDHLTAWQNVAFSLRGPDRRRRAEELLDRFGLTPRASARPPHLSGGERQRVALARALASDPQLLLLDEPLAALDSQTRGEATRTLHRLLTGEGIPTVLVTHDFVEAATLGDEVAVLEDGRIVQRGDAATLSARPATAFVAGLTGASVLRGTARDDAERLIRIDLDGGGVVFSTDPGSGPVAVSVHPWEILLEPAETTSVSSARNRLASTVETVATIGNRVRVLLRCPQPLTVELTEPAARALALEPGSAVIATWKATATRVTAR